jgi:transposase InsO family protein
MRQPTSSVTIDSPNHPANLTALWDTGATESYIDHQAATQFADLYRPYPNPVELRLFDGRASSAGLIKHYLDFKIRVHPDHAAVPTRVNVTKLCGADIVLGSSWMTKNGVNIDLPSSTLTIGLPRNGPPKPPQSILRATSMDPRNPCTYPNNIALSSRSKWTTKRETRISPSIAEATQAEPTQETESQEPETLSSIVETTRAETTPALASGPQVPLSETKPENTIHSETKPTTKTLETEVLSERRPKEQPRIEILAATGTLPETKFETQPKLTEVPDGTTTMNHEEPKDDTETETQELLKLLPSHYHGYLDIFSQKQGTQTLPPHRAYDMRIDLRPSAKLSVAKLYQLTEVERLVLIDTLKRETAAGRIRPSNAAYGSPMFFVAKKDGRHRLVVDYRQLNENTIADVYPLPLINQITSELSKAKYFTKLDLVGAYQLLRIAEGYEHLTAFRTQYGMYGSLVVRDGLRNAPAVFQHFLNDVFKEVLGQGVTIYIDDILIYADNLDELRRITRRVFDIIRGTSLYLKASKCEFERTSVTFLGFIVSEKGVESDPEKVKSIQEFPAPANLRESRSFMGLVSYYRRFVPNFSRIAAPITELTRKDRIFDWGPDQQQAFEELKRLFTTAPILAHFDPTRQTILQTDASYFGWGYILSQIDPETRREHPIAIESGRFTGSQLNYSTKEKEFMAIVEAFRRCRHMLLQVHTTVLTDHLNLKYWMEPQQLNSRQARWVETISPFRLSIVYRPGKEATMPDALSRRSDYHPGKGATTDLECNFAQALPNFADDPGGIDDPSNGPAILRALQRPIVIGREYFVEDNDITQGLAEDPIISPIHDEMKAVICYRCDHNTCRNPRISSTNLDNLRRISRDLRLSSPTWSKRGFLLLDSRVYIPDFNNARLKIMQSRHDSPMAGHQGITKTIELIARDYIWSGMNKDIETYISGCAVCQRTKVSKQKSHGLLKTLEVPTRPWVDISMDFVEQLPKSSGYDSILVIIDRLTKWAIFVPTTSRITSAKLAELLLDHLVSQHGLPTTIVSDRGSKFTSKLWRYLTGRLGISLRLSTAFHPQTDGQTERVNQVLEQYLRIFTSYNQDDWSTLLSQASFTYNNSQHSAIKTTPFYANFGYHPRWVDEFQQTSESESPEGLRIADSITAVHDQCKANIAEANENYAKYYNQRRQDAPEFDIGDEVLLSMRNIATTRPTKKFDTRQSGPYRIIQRIGTHAYRLELPGSARIHDVFHVALLQAYRPPTYPGQTAEPPGPVEITDEGEEYEVANIVDSRRNSRTGRLEYLVEWLGYEGTDEHTTWEPKGNLSSAEEMLAEFHLRYPEKPSTDGSPRRR